MRASSALRPRLTAFIILAGVTETVSVIVQQAFKDRFFPTHEQAAQLAKTFGYARSVYNQALAFRTSAGRQEKHSIGSPLTSANLTDWKKEPEKAFLSEGSSVTLQPSLRHLEVASPNFFEQPSQDPPSKPRHGRPAPRSAPNACPERHGRITLAKASKPLDIVWSRPPPDDATLLHLLVR